MNKLYVAILLIMVFGCTSQKNSTPNKTYTELKPPFSNQGEQEDYWVQELFKKKYKKTNYKAYSGKIIEKSRTEFIYGNKLFKVYVSNEDLRMIFKKGILYPQLISGYTDKPRKSKQELDSLTDAQRYFYELSRGDNLTITNLEELKFLSNSPKVKRFRFWLSEPMNANPQVYLFELTNDKANKNTNLKKFIKKAKLTFFKYGWIII